MPISADFGKALREARRSAGMTQVQLAAAVGISQADIALLELGRRGVDRSPELVAKLEGVLGLAPGTLAQYLPAGHAARAIALTQVPLVGGGKLDLTEFLEGTTAIPLQTAITLKLAKGTLLCVPKPDNKATRPVVLRRGKLVILGPGASPGPDDHLLGYLCAILTG
jgi:transcriptional regulator with XRE-family HTH domain